MKFLLAIYYIVLFFSVLLVLYVVTSVQRAPDLHPSKPIAEVVL